MCMFVFMCTLLCCRVSVFFFSKQKTAYEMRISDWSSDVCSSALVDNHQAGVGSMAETLQPNQLGQPGYEGYLNDRVASIAELQIGRASCRERVCQYV